MPASSSIGAHEPQLELWQKALESERGIKVNCASNADALALRHRLYYARQAQCRLHRKAYPSDHPQHGRSFYEELTVKVSDNILTIEKVANIQFDVEEL